MAPQLIKEVSLVVRLELPGGMLEFPQHRKVTHPTHSLALCVTTGAKLAFATSIMT